MGVRFENGFLRNESDAGKPVSRTVEMIQHLNDFWSGVKTTSEGMNMKECLLFSSQPHIDSPRRVRDGEVERGRENMKRRSAG